MTESFGFIPLPGGEVSLRSTSLQRVVICPLIIKYDVIYSKYRRNYIRLKHGHMTTQQDMTWEWIQLPLGYNIVHRLPDRLLLIPPNTLSF